MIPDELQPDNLLRAYGAGIFPMADDSGEISWYSPDPRAVIDLKQFKTPRSLRQRINKGGYRVTIDTCFERVMRQCARRSEGTWISEDIIAAYCELHKLGYAHSFETYYGEHLAGGLYGVSLAGAYFGESMFTAKTDGSKLALVALVNRMRERNMTLLDIQFITPHLKRFGAGEISRAKYMDELAAALKADTRLTD